MTQALEQIVQKAKQLFKKKEYSKVIELLDDELLMRYDHAPLYCWRSKAHGEISETELELIYAQKSIDTDPLLGKGYLLRGNVWYKKEEYDKAIEDYSEAIRLEPEDAESYFKRGIAWLEKKEQDQAVLDFSESIRLKSDESAVYYNRGIVWYNREDYDKAIADFSEAIRLEPVSLPHLVSQF